MNLAVVTKPRLIGALGLLAVMPWFSGSKDAPAALISFFALFLALFLVWRSDSEFRLAGRAAVLLLALLAWGGISLVWSINRYQTVSWLIVLAMVVAAFALGSWLRLADRWQSWLRGYLAVATAFSLYGVYLLIAADYNRLTSTFYWANPMASYLLPAVFLSYFWWAQNGRKLDGVMALITGTSLLLTYSRGGIGVALVVGLVTLLLTHRSKRFWLRFVFTLVLAFGLSTLIPQLRGLVAGTTTPSLSQESRFAEAARGESVSIQDRLNYIDGSVAIWRGRPLLGSGAGTWSTAYPQHQQRVISAATDAHNWYGQTAAELGVIGFGLLIATIFVTAWSARYGLKDSRLMPAAMGWAALTLHLGLDIGPSYPAILILWGVFSGMVYRPVRSRHWPVLAVLLCGVVLAWPVVAWYQSRSLSDQGQVWQDNHDYQKAAEVFDTATRGPVYDPDSVNAQGINYYTLAVSGIHVRANADLALKSAERAAKLDPLDSQHIFLQARAMILLQRYDEAEQSYRRAIELDGLNHPDYYVDLARLLMYRQRWSHAKTELDKVIELYPKEVVDNRSPDESVAPLIETAKALRQQLEPHLAGS